MVRENIKKLRKTSLLFQRRIHCLVIQCFRDKSLLVSWFLARSGETLDQHVSRLSEAGLWLLIKQQMMVN